MSKDKTLNELIIDEAVNKFKNVINNKNNVTTWFRRVFNRSTS